MKDKLIHNLKQLSREIPHFSGFGLTSDMITEDKINAIFQEYIKPLKLKNIENAIQEFKEILEEDITNYLSQDQINKLWDIYVQWEK